MCVVCMLLDLAKGGHCNRDSVCARGIFIFVRYSPPLTVRSNRSAHLNARPHFIFYDYVINNFVIIISFVCVLLILLLLYYNMLEM